MRNDQLGVLLRDFARRCLEWAATLEKAEPGDPVTDLAFLEQNPFMVPRPSDVPTTVQGTPSPTDGGASFRRQAEAIAKFDAKHPNVMAPLTTAYVKQELPRHDAVVDADRLPMTFRCPSCGQVRRWHMAKPPWPDAVCATCYAERQDHREGY